MDSRQDESASLYEPSSPKANEESQRAPASPGRGGAKLRLSDDGRANLHPSRIMAVSKYEYARLMCARVTALSRNATPAIGDYSPSEPGGLLHLAEAEFKLGVLPFSLARRMPSGGDVVYPTDKLYRLPSCTHPTVGDVLTNSVHK